MPYNVNQTVVSQLFSFEDFIFTQFITGTIVDADVGKAVTIDTAAANSVKLTADNDHITGRLESYENRAQDGIKVAAISRKFRAILPSTGSPALGDEVCGSSTPGVVKSVTSQPAVALRSNRVIEILTGNRVVVEKI